jgi:Flp pilus assembly pilin Flp
MRAVIKAFARTESGAVALDWLLLTATAIGLAIGGLTMMQSNAADVSDASGDAQSHPSEFGTP